MAIPTVYIETLIVSYLTARRAGDLLAAARREATIDWWDSHRTRFSLRVSQVVLDEVGRGNPEAARRRLDALSGIDSVELTRSATDLAQALLVAKALPAKALVDALHVGVCAVHGVNYLLTWNYRHIDNAETKPLMRSTCSELGFTCPEICTPHELMGADSDG